MLSHRLDSSQGYLHPSRTATDPALLGPPLSTCRTWCRDGHKIYSQKHVGHLLDLTDQTRREHCNLTPGLTAITLSDDGEHTHVKLRKQIPNDVSLKRESMLVTVLIFHYQPLINPINTSPSLLDWLPR